MGQSPPLLSRPAGAARGALPAAGLPAPSTAEQGEPRQGGREEGREGCGEEGAAAAQWQRGGQRDRQARVCVGRACRLYACASQGPSRAEQPACRDGRAGRAGPGRRRGGARGRGRDTTGLSPRGRAESCQGRGEPPPPRKDHSLSRCYRNDISGTGLNEATPRCEAAPIAARGRAPWGRCPRAGECRRKASVQPWKAVRCLFAVIVFVTPLVKRSLAKRRLREPQNPPQIAGETLLRVCTCKAGRLCVRALVFVWGLDHIKLSRASC